MFEEEEKDGVAVGKVLLPLNDQLHLDSKDYVTVWNVLRGEGGGCGGVREGGREGVFIRIWTVRTGRTLGRCQLK